jgi:hypothetical protein
LTLEYTDREKVPLSKKLNPAWWFGNDTEQAVEQATWYHPEWPEWRRRAMWNLRNPLQNFRAYVIGVQDRNYTVDVVKGNPDPNVVQRDDVGELGWQVSTLKFDSGLKLPWVSYSGEHIVWQFGWQPSGFVGVKLNVRKERVG